MGYGERTVNIEWEINVQGSRKWKQLNNLKKRKIMTNHKRWFNAFALKVFYLYILDNLNFVSDHLFLKLRDKPWASLIFELY